MKNTLLDKIIPIGKLSKEEKEVFLEILNEESIKKGDLIWKPGKIADKMYFLVKGGFRSYFIKNGEEITDYFFFEDSFATDYASYFSGTSSRFYLEAIEDTLALTYSRKRICEVAKKYPTFQKFLTIHAEMAFLEIEERMRILQNETLEVKYQYTLSKFPYLFQRAPQHQIASYLGVKPESLSRIKRKKAPLSNRT